MEIAFTKMQALGNDFVVIDATHEPVSLTCAQAQLVADRHRGIGCDQILIVETSERSDIDFKYRILNSDGSEVGQCGNGARCFLQFVHERGLTDKNPVSVETISGDFLLEQDRQSGLVTVNMGVPDFSPAGIPLQAEREQNLYSINKDGDAIEFAALSIGNPHAVITVEDVDHAPVSLIGPMLESHPVFPQRSNVGFMQINSRNRISLRVYERGAGETLACGSGACAAAIAGIRSRHLDSPVEVLLPGGELTIRWQGDDSPVYLTGPASTSFTGKIALQDDPQ